MAIQRCQFEIATVFDPEDPLAVFVVALSSALRDLVYVNNQLVELMASDPIEARVRGDRLYLLRLNIGHLHEVERTIAEGRKSASISSFLSGLDSDTQENLAIVMSERDEGIEWVGKAIAYMRNQAFHYGTEKNLNAVRWAISEVTTGDWSEGSISGAGGKFGELDLNFVDHISTQHLHKFPLEQFDEKKSVDAFFDAVGIATRAAIRLSMAVLVAYLETREEDLDFDYLQ